MKEARVRPAFEEDEADELLDRQRYTAKLREAEIEAAHTKRLFTKSEVDAEAQRVFESWGV